MLGNKGVDKSIEAVVTSVRVVAGWLIIIQEYSRSDSLPVLLTAISLIYSRLFNKNKWWWVAYLL